MLNKNFRRLAALTLAMLLLLCAGCGSSPEPAADTPAPSQTPAATPEPTTDPDAEQAPVPEAASTPTDVNAPSGPVTAPSISIERETPAYLQLLTMNASFTLTNAEGQTLTHNGTGTSGTMDYTQQQMPDSSLFSVLIPYSDSLSFETAGTSGDWGFEIIGSGSTAYNWCHGVAKGSGKLDGLVYETGAGLTVRTEQGAKLELTLPMAGSYLGESGWVRLRVTAGEREVSLKAEDEDSVFSYSGVDANASAQFDYGGIRSDEGFDISSSSGSVGFSSIGAGSAAS